MKYKNMYSVAREFRKSPTSSERILWNALRNRQFNNLKFRRQYIVAGFILDFYCSSLKLGIEVDCDVHGREEIIEYDNERDVVLKEHGVTIIRIESKAIELSVYSVLCKINLFLATLSNKVGEGVTIPL